MLHTLTAVARSIAFDDLHLEDDASVQAYLEEFGGVDELLPHCVPASATASVSGGGSSVVTASPSASSRSSSVRLDASLASYSRLLDHRLGLSTSHLSNHAPSPRNPLATPARRRVSFANPTVAVDGTTYTYSSPPEALVLAAVDACDTAFQAPEDTFGLGPTWPAAPWGMPLVDVESRHVLICDGLWLGSLASVAGGHIPRRCHVLSLLDGDSLPLPRPCEFHIAQAEDRSLIKVADGPLGNLRYHLAAYLEIFEAAHHSGRALLIHCVAGLNRSAQVAVALLMLCYRMPLAKAVPHVERARGLHIVSNRMLRRELFGLNSCLVRAGWYSG